MLDVGGFPLRHHTGNYLPAVPAINAEVGIRSENDRIGECFGHPHKAGVGEAHGHVRDFCRSLSTDSMSLSRLKTATRARRRSRAVSAGAPLAPRRWNASERTASQAARVEVGHSLA